MLTQYTCQQCPIADSIKADIHQCTTHKLFWRLGNRKIKSRIHRQFRLNWGPALFPDLRQSHLRTVFLISLLAVLATSSCASDSEVAQREEYWKSEADSFFQTPRHMDDLHSWLREMRVFYTFEDHEIANGEWARALERINVDGFVCESWTIQLSVAVGDEGEILTHTVSKSGTCL